MITKISQHKLMDENRRLCIKEYNEGNIRLNSRPFSLVMLITTRCNISCIMCGWQNSHAQLPYEAAEKISGLLSTLESLNWQGGEVFLVDYFQEFFVRIADQFPHVNQSISTNGLFIDKNWAKILARANLFITFSIDSTNKETYEYIRKGARFEDLIKGIDNLNEAIEKNNNGNVNKVIFVVVMKSNYRDLLSFIDFAKKYRFSRIQFVQKFGSLPAEDIFEPRDPEAMDYLKKLFPQIEEEAKKSGISVSHPFGYLFSSDSQKSAANKSDILNPQLNQLLKCGCPWYKLTVLPTGEIKPDCICQRAVGNILKDDLIEAWNSPAMQLYRQKIISNDMRDFCAPACLDGTYLSLYINPLFKNNLQNDAR